MTCQTFTSTNYGRSYKGRNLSVISGSPPCQGLGYTRMLVADCWEPGSQAPPSYGGWCLYNNEVYTITNTPTGCPSCEPAPPTLNPNQPCDCVNGGCVAKTTYNTPGVFPTLAACISGCAKNSDCTGECVDPAEIAAHRQALNTLQSKFCR
jgi:hypothetical protein